jgi:hypothetical protein
MNTEQQLFELYRKGNKLTRSQLAQVLGWLDLQWLETVKEGSAQDQTDAYNWWAKVLGDMNKATA